VRYWLTILIIFSLTACSTKWYHPVKGDAEFARDRAECESIAEFSGLNASHTGQRVELNAYYDALNRCLTRKGWSLNPPQAKTTGKPPAPQRLTEKISSNVYKFDKKKLALPQGFHLTSHKLTSAGPLIMEILEFDGVLNDTPYDGQIIFQEALGKSKFKPITYPLTKPFFTYSLGKLPNGIRWHSFAGKLDEEWYGGVGSYWVISKRKRVIATLTTPLPDQNTPPPARCRLNDAQAKKLDNFLIAILPWFEELEEKKIRRDIFTRERFRFQLAD